ncbi:Fucose permease [Modestobacter sp. DSM 44400]|uniref:MFS transporter n=1 Tax=Modestobacter sp. DSM 44400 TaxID=1550230 RepID=UPI00089D108D|nr:MFS transporter [Modestobacter sp. DSM 44400]SDX60344.1 Fucose permease [Modestobacter sp. DSM 44400]
MATDLQAPALPALRRARAGVAACFFTNAVLFANLVPRYPEVKDRLGLSNAAFGAALAAFPLGSLLAALSAGALIRRFGSARLASSGLVLLAVALWAAAVAPAWWVLAAALLVGGALDAVVDVAQNAHGLRLQRHYGRSILNAFHGVWSIGAVTGGLLGSAAAGLGVPLAVHLAVSTAVFSVLALLSARLMLPGSDTADRAPDRLPGDAAPGHATSGDAAAGRGSVRRAAVPMLGALGVLVVCGAFVEDAGASWSALYLRNDLGAGAAVAGLGFVALQSAMTIGRLTGDRVVDRFGQRRVARAGGVAIAGGMGLALTFPSVPATLAGFALAGLGVATLIPAVFAAADAPSGLPHGTGLAVSNWLMRIGFLLSPPLIGLVADAAGLRTALLTVVLAGAGVLVLGRVPRTSVGPERTPARPDQ